MIGQNILHYKILDKLGQGGMGIVYLAEDTRLERKVAIKFLPHHISANREEKERFKIEAKAAAALNHPNIATIYSIEETEDSRGEEEMFIVMEYIEGKELKDVIESKHAGAEYIQPLQLNDIINYAIQIAEGLEAAHKKEIVHRDIKSSNIMITENGKVKIMDFGLAKIRGGSQLTTIGATIGTAAYMSPEQAKGDEVDNRTDIWSFGVLLYEMLTGKLPFKGEYDQAIIYSILSEKPEPIARRNFPPSLISIINKCLQKDKNTRYQSITDLLDNLKAVQKDPDAKVKKGEKIFFKDNYRHKNIFIIGGIGLSVIILLFILPFSRNFFISLVNPGPVSPEKHLLILPFNTIGGDSSKEAFCDGLAETLSSNLTQMEQFQGSLWVVPSGDVIQYNIKSASEAYKMYGANLVVTGSLQFLNNLLRLTINLVDAKNLRQLNSSIIDVKSKNIPSIQNRVVVKLLEMLHIEMDPGLKGTLDAGNTSNPEAYEYYVRGRGNLQRYENPDNVEEAINLFKLAAESDTSYALAYAGLGEAYLRKYEITQNSELINLAKENAKKAFKIDNMLAPINVTLGMIYSATGNYKLAIEHFKSALLSDPNNAAAFRCLAKAYESSDDNPGAESIYKRAIELKPDFTDAYFNRGLFWYRANSYEDALNDFLKVIEMNPHYSEVYLLIGDLNWKNKDYANAVKYYSQAIEVKPGNMSAYYKRAHAKRILMDYDGALEDFNRFIALNPNVGQIGLTSSIKRLFWEEIKRAKFQFSSLN